MSDDMKDREASTPIRGRCSHKRNVWLDTITNHVRHTGPGTICNGEVRWHGDSPSEETVT